MLRSKLFGLSEFGLQAVSALLCSNHVREKENKRTVYLKSQSPKTPSPRKLPNKMVFLNQPSEFTLLSF